MTDNIELRLDQLTEAIKGLYAKSSMSQGEIYNALTSLSQRYENLTNVSGEKLTAAIVNEFKKTIDIKQEQTTRNLKELEGSLKNLLSRPGVQNPQSEAEMTKLLGDISNLHQKLNGQGASLEKILTGVQTQKNSDPSMELAKLSENFHTFSKGFENITSTLNKNFADFLEQVRRFNSKDEINAMRAEITSMKNNVNSAVDSISEIDSKYKDLAGLIETVSEKESVFSQAVKEINALSDILNSIKDEISQISTKEDFDNFGYELKEKINNIKTALDNLQEPKNINLDSTLDSIIEPLRTSINGISDDVKTIWANFQDTRNEIQNTSISLGSIDDNLKEIKNIINTNNLTQNPALGLEETKNEIKGLIAGLTSFKNDINAINQGNIKILQEPIEKAIADLKNQDLGKTIEDLATNLRKVTAEIQYSISGLQKTIGEINNVSTVQILTQISEALPGISDRMEIFRSNVVTENSANFTRLQNNFQGILNSIRDNLDIAIKKINEDSKSNNFEIVNAIKTDLMKLSEALGNNVENINLKIQKELNEFKTYFQDLTTKQAGALENISDKLSAFEISLENLERNTIDKLNDNLTMNNAFSQDSLNELRSNILENIVNVEKSNKDSIARFDTKINRILNSYFGPQLDNITDKKPLVELLDELDVKIDRANLQQIHNAKELLEEIQTVSNNITSKITALEENKDSISTLEVVTKISEKLNGLENQGEELGDSVKLFKEQIEQKLKENVQKISALIEEINLEGKEHRSANNIDGLSNKVEEYLSNFEYLKSNISQEIKENLESEFNKLDTSIKKLRTSDENSNYSYTLEDVESDLAKIRLIIEKGNSQGNDFKSIFEKIVELRTVGLENVKINRDVESELARLSGWFKDTIGKLDDLQDKLDDIQNIGFEDIKTRLLQSEKSKSMSSESSLKMENALKHLIKNAQIQENKINDISKKLEVLSQAQSENFNPAQFIDIFYENMTQTKMLSNRVEIIEDKINTIQNSVEKLIAYVEN